MSFLVGKYVYTEPKSLMPSTYHPVFFYELFGSDLRVIARMRVPTQYPHFARVKVLP